MQHVDIAVIGGGITGQLVQFLVPHAQIFDWKPYTQRVRPITRQFGANYLWRPLDGIPCRSFPVETRIDGVMPTLEAVKRYKSKILKTNDVEGWERQFTPSMTGYDFLELPQASIQFDHRIVEINAGTRVITFEKENKIHYNWLVSTIPLYSLLALIGWAEPEGRLMFKPIFVKVEGRPDDAPFPRDTLYVNYLSDGTVIPYRFCDRGDQRHYESIFPFDNGSTKRIIPGKVYFHPGVPAVLDRLRMKHIQTFGRYGNWAPNELVHETYDAIVTWREEFCI